MAMKNATFPLIETDQALILDEGVVTLADRHFFSGFVLLYESIQNCFPVPVCCFDGGLSKEQIQWAERHLENCIIMDIPDDDDITLVMENLSGVSNNQTNDSLLWICPFLIKHSPYRRVVWLDSDLLVVSRLGSLFDHINDGPVFTLENHNPSKTANHPSLYSEMPLQRNTDAPVPLINAGVSGWDIVRDKDVIEDYMKPVLQACKNTKIREAISWHDQGCLIWAIQNSELNDRVLNDRNWNLCAKHVVNAVDYNLDKNLQEQLGVAYPGASIVHWNGFKLQEKLFNRLGSTQDILNAVLRRLPGPDYVSGKEKANLPIKLISYISSATSSALLSEFLLHYQKLGVDDLLIILHKVDENYHRAECLLSKFGVNPVMYVNDYSAKLKNSRIADIKDQYISPDDWIIYADVDELQIYPVALVQLLKKCDSYGYHSLSGYFIDRIAENGELKEISECTSIWEQFPYRADVASEITGAWNRKVCAAKGSVSLNYSGSHHRVYGCNSAQEYKSTYLEHTNWPQAVEIHHFKWDASLKTRLENKLNGVGGDKDAIHGKEFINEYRSLLSHVDKNKRIVVRGSKLAEIPRIEMKV